MIVMGALVVGLALGLYALLIYGLFLVARSLSAHSPATRSRWQRAFVVSLLHATIGVLVLTPVCFVLIYYPIMSVSSDGETELGVFKPRLVDRVGPAIELSVAISIVISVGGVAAHAIYVRRNRL